MGSSPPPAPPAPDPTVTAEAQTGENVQTAIANAELSHVDQTDQFGNTTNWTQNGTYYMPNPLTGQGTTGYVPGTPAAPSAPTTSTASSTPSYTPSYTGNLAASGGYANTVGGGGYSGPYGPTGGGTSSVPAGVGTSLYGGNTGGYAIPTFSETTTMSPANEAIYQTAQGAEQNIANTAKTLSGQAQDRLQTPIDLSANGINNFLNTQWEQPFATQWGQQQEELNQNLADQGVNLNDPAYKVAQNNFGQEMQNAQDTYDTNMYGEGLQAATTSYNEPINELSALLSMSQVNNPQFQPVPQTTIPTTDYAQIAQNSFQDQLAAAQYQNQANAANNAGLFGLGGSVLGGLISLA